MDQPLPRISPYLYRRAPDLCRRRLALEFESEPAAGSPVNRARLRDAFLAAARLNHAEPRPAALEFFTQPPDLEPEERAVFEQLGRWYVALYGDRPVSVHLHDCDQPTESPARGLRVGGWVDLTVVGVGGEPELRQFAPWNRMPRDSVLDAEHVKLALLRLARWTAGRPLRVSSADLVRGDIREATVDTASVVGELAAELDARVDLVRTRADREEAEPGADCASCRYTGSCRAIKGAAGTSPRRDPRPGTIVLHPTTLERWMRCPRSWYLADVLGVPASDEPPSPDHGQFVHDMLHKIHEWGSCHDPAHVDDVLARHGIEGPGRVRDEIAAHERRCPIDAKEIGHERTLVRFHRPPRTLFLGSARLDALWAHDGVLDARDYKTGALHVHRVADDPRARLQAWVLAPLAEQLGLRVQLRYEYLSSQVADDPDVFEPDADDLDAIGRELDDVVAGMWGADAFRGVADPAVCGTCTYRAICADTAAPTEPTWPVVLDVEDA